MQARLLLLVALLATALVYWTGLAGPFLLDDMANLAPVQRWLQGQASWQQVLLGNGSGMLGRSVSMASFMLSAALGGYTPYTFKLGNLVLHLACGLLGWLMLRRALAEDPRLAPHATLVASLVAAIWWLHPLNVSTVLYAVQRMAQLGALFVLASVWTYLVARRNLLSGQHRRGMLGLFVLFPALVLAGLLSKENAAVAPALCLVFELAYFAGRGHPRSRVVTVFFGVFLLAPLLLGLIAFLVEPGRLLGGYAVRDFSLGERLLSQPRALMEYVGALAFPRNSVFGVYADDFQASTGLLSPASTSWALLALIGLSAVAITLRKRAPSVFAGWFFFLVAHGVESSIFPLELYFEHRNYLPAFGLLLALAGLAALVPRNLATHVLSPRQLGLFCAGSFAVVFALITLGRAKAWQHEELIVEEAVKSHPESLRANLAKATIALRRGRMQHSYDAVATLLESDNPRNRQLARIHWVTLDCISGKGANPADLRQAVAEAMPKVTALEAQAFELLASVNNDHDCGIVSPGLIADSIVRMLDSAQAQPDHVAPKWRLRHTAARMYARAGRWAEALPQARLSWQPTAAPKAGGFLVHAYLRNNMHPLAERTFAEVAARVDEHDSAGKAGLAGLRTMLDRR